MLDKVKAFWRDYNPYIYCVTVIVAILILSIMGSRDNVKVGLTESEQHAAKALEWKAKASEAEAQIEAQQRTIDSLGREFNKTVHELEGTKELLKYIDRQTEKNVEQELTATDSVAYANLHKRAKSSNFYRP